MTTTFEHADQTELTRKLIASVQALGYTVIPESGGVSVAELARQLRRSVASVSRSLSRAIQQGIEVKATRGKSGRILRIWTSDALMQFLRKP